MHSFPGYFHFQTAIVSKSGTEINYTFYVHFWKEARLSSAYKT